jgi:hypothetical protein
MQDGDLELLVPGVVVEEFERNRERIEQSMTTSVAARFKGLRKDLEDLSAESHRPAFDAIAGLAHEMPLIGAMAMRNFTDILALLKKGRQMNATDVAQIRVVSRALQKRAPFHLNKNSVADALLAELYAEVIEGEATEKERYGFVTSNHEDFSVQQGDRREPHSDLAGLFDGSTSRYFYRMRDYRRLWPATWATSSNDCSQNRTSRSIHGP